MDTFHEMLSSLHNLNDSYWWGGQTTSQPTIEQVLEHDIAACECGCGEYEEPQSMYYDKRHNRLYLDQQHYQKDREVLTIIGED